MSHHHWDCRATGMCAYPRVLTPMMPPLNFVLSHSLILRCHSSWAHEPWGGDTCAPRHLQSSPYPCSIPALPGPAAAGVFSFPTYQGWQ